MKMSAELTRMLAASKAARKSPVSRETTPTQRKLKSIAKKIIRKVDGYQPKADHNPQIPAECCGVNGLRPTWHGRAS